MVYTPVTVGSSGTSASTNPWAQSEFYFNNGTLSATNNPFGGTNVPWIMDPETRRETYRGYTDKTAYDKAYADAVKNFGIAGITTAFGPGSTGGTTRQTSKSIKQFNMQQVEGLATSAFQAAIGRAATQEELATFLKHLNDEEKKNPTVTKTTTKSGGRSATSTSISTGGIDESQFAVSQSQMHPEFANYQKATTYFDAMTSALHGPTGGGF